MKSNSGQAVIEYFLLLVVTVTIMIGMSKVFKVIDEGMNRYIGDYTICLMDYGELPSLGIQQADLKKHASGGQGCDAKFAAFTFSEGRPPTGGSGSGGGRNGSSANGRGQSDKSGKDSAAAASSEKKDGSVEDDSETEGGAGGLRGGRRKGSKSASVNPIRTGASVGGTLDRYGDGLDSKVKVLEEEDVSSEKKKRNRRSTRNTAKYSRESYRALSGKMAQEILKNQRRTSIRLPSTTTKVISVEEERFRPYKKQFTPPEQKKFVETADNNSGFGFGNILRWVMIAGMIVAIIVFFGGQLLNYSNSDS